MNTKLLLNEVSQISKKHDIINQKTGGYFNIFDITNISYDEVKICRFIYELINPKGSHYQGKLYLKLFVENVLDLKFTEKEYKELKMHREYMTSEGRRIDLVIETSERFIPIEVKIYAKDQVNQCSDYYKLSKNSNVFYLTLDGCIPSSESAKGLTIKYEDKEIIGYEEVTQISFKEHILLWLDECIRCQETIKIAPIREVILQFIYIIRKATNLLVGEKEMEIVDTIISSKENMKAAIDIEKSLKICKVEMMEKIFDSIESQINKQRIITEHDYKDNNYKRISAYYDRKGSTYPSISYVIKSLDKQDVDLWFRIEIQEKIFAGFCTPKQEKFKGKQLTNEEINDMLCIENPNIDGWWIHWEYLPNDNKLDTPDFRNFNDAYFDLFDDNKFNEFIDNSVNAINNMFNSIK